MHFEHIQSVFASNTNTPHKLFALILYLLSFLSTCERTELGIFAIAKSWLTLKTK